jgi:hypothetical protein
VSPREITPQQPSLLFAARPCGPVLPSLRRRPCPPPAPPSSVPRGPLPLPPRARRSLLRGRLRPCPPRAPSFAPRGPLPLPPRTRRTHLSARPAPPPSPACGVVQLRPPPPAARAATLDGGRTRQGRLCHWCSFSTPEGVPGHAPDVSSNPCWALLSSTTGTAAARRGRTGPGRRNSHSRRCNGR